MPEHNREQQIWESFRAGNEAAFTRLFHLYSDALFYYGCSFTDDRELIKDSIQELLCSLWERKAQCPKVKKVKPFLLSALRRIVLRKIKYEKRFAPAPGDEDPTASICHPGETISAEEQLIQQERKTLSKLQLKKAIESLPPRQREAIHLRYYQGLSYEEMAKVMAVQKDSIGQFITQAVRGLRKKMKRTNSTFPLLFLSLLFSQF